MFAITPIYAIILAALLLVLGAMVSIKRAKTGISIMHGDDMSLAESIRRHGNLAENAAVFLILLALAEANGAGANWLHAAGIIFVVGRLMHPFGIEQGRVNAPLRAVAALGNSIGMLVLIVAMALQMM